MANPYWPGTLPKPLVEGVSYESLPNIIRTEMDAGRPKMRRRFTAVGENVTFALLLTRDQVATLRTFVEVTLKDVLPFDWREFRTDAGSATYRFRSRPKFTPVESGQLWRAELELERLP